MAGGKEGEDEEPDKMAMAIGRFGRFKRWVIRQIVRCFVGLYKKILRGIRGPSTEENDIALEVNPEIDVFQVKYSIDYIFN
jgi:hypothetical protein